MDAGFRAHAKGVVTGKCNVSPLDCTWSKWHERRHMSRPKHADSLAPHYQHQTAPVAAMLEGVHARLELHRAEAGQLSVYWTAPVQRSLKSL